MNRGLLLDAVGHLDVGFVEKCLAYEAAVSSIPKRNWNAVFRRVAVVVACLCIAFIGVLHMQKNFSPQENLPTITEEGVYIPPKEFYSGEAGGDAYYCVAYGDRVYFWQNSIKEKETDLVGDALGSGVTSDKISIDLYEVKGYSPEFMVCNRLGDEVQIFVCDSGMTLKNGEDFFGDRMHLAENVKDVYYAENEDAPFVKFSAEAMPIVRDFLDALYAGAFAITRDMEHQSVYGYRLAFEMENGLTFYVDLSYGGYASFRIPLYGSMDVCIPIEKDVYATFIDYLTAENGAYIPPISGTEEMLASPAVFHNGHGYYLYETSENKDICGGELGIGTVVSPKPLSDSSLYSPKIYEVKGYSSDFLICRKWENGQIDIYISPDNMTMKNGGELFHDLMHLSDNTKAVFLGETEMAEEDLSVVAELLQVMSTEKFVIRDADEVDSSMCKRHLIHFEAKNGIGFSIVHSDAGYVWWQLHEFSSNMQVCIPVGSDLSQRLVEVLEKYCE